jgi:hypothetical protein
MYVLLFLLLCMFCMLRMFRSVHSVSLYCSVYCLCVNVYCTTATGISGHFSATLTEVFPCFFLSCKANCKGITRKHRVRPTLPKFLFLFIMYVPFSVFCVLFVCKCVLYCRHRVSTHLQLKINNNKNNNNKSSLRPQILLYQYAVISTVCLQCSSDTLQTTPTQQPITASDKIEPNTTQHTCLCCYT